MNKDVVYPEKNTTSANRHISLPYSLMPTSLATAAARRSFVAGNPAPHRRRSTAQLARRRLHRYYCRSEHVHLKCDGSVPTAAMVVMLVVVAAVAVSLESYFCHFGTTHLPYPRDNRRVFNEPFQLLPYLEAYVCREDKVESNVCREYDGRRRPSFHQTSATYPPQSHPLANFPATKAIHRLPQPDCSRR